MSHTMTRNLMVLIVSVLIAPVASAGGDVEAGRAKSTTCAACHGELGQSTTPEYPDLAGQHQSYLEHALKAYRSGARKNPIMAGFVSGLTDQDIADLAAYYAAQEDLFTLEDR